MLRLKNDVYYYDKWNQNGVTVAFSTNKGGVKDIDNGNNNIGLQIENQKEQAIENRKIFANKTGYKLTDFVFAQQKHTSRICEVFNTNKGQGTIDFEDGIDNVDGLYTKEDNIVLTSLHADCTPVYIYSKDDNLISIIHAGWKGTVNQIVYNAIEKFRKEGSNIKDIEVFIGPSISQSNFEVGQDVINYINEIDYLIDQDVYKKKGNGKYLVDIKNINKLQLIAAGVDQKNIDISDMCTYQNDKFFSYRKNNKTGRMIGCIVKETK